MAMQLSDEDIVVGLVQRMDLHTLRRVKREVQGRINMFLELSTQLTEVERQLAVENKISCVKAIRARTGLGLRESKWVMDSYLATTTKDG